MKDDQKARNILAEILSIPPISVNSSVRIGAVKQWDSITHMNLVLAIEEEIGRRLSSAELLSIDGFDTLKAFFDAEPG